MKVDKDGNWQVEVRLNDPIRNGTGPSREWNAIEIIAYGSDHWFVANDIVLASLSNNARSVGVVALSVTNWDVENDAEFTFSNVTVTTVR